MNTENRTHHAPGLGLLAAFLLLGASVLAEDAPRTTRAVRASGKVQVDGRLDEGFWKGAPAVELTRLGKGTKPARQTRVRTAYDDEALYIGFSCDDDMKKLVAVPTGRDDKTWMSDCVEVFLDANNDRNSYYHFILNAANCIFDEYAVHNIDEMGKYIDIDWDGQWQHAVSKGPDQWSAEIRIPFSTVVQPGTRQTWGVTFAREEFPSSEFSVWPAEAKFGDPTVEGEIVGIEANLAPYRYDFDVLDFGVRQPGQNNLKLTVRNRTAATRPATLECRTVSPDGRTFLRKVDVTPKVQSMLHVETPYELAASGEHQMWLTLREAATGRILRSSRCHRTGPVGPLTAYLTRPWYRNSIYATAPVDAVEVMCEVNRPLAGRDYGLSAELREGEAVLASTRLNVTKARHALALPAADLKQGEYRVRVALSDAGKAVTEAALPLWKLAPSPVEVRIDRHGRFVVRGKPFFPLGMWDVHLDHQALTEYQAAGFNTVHPPPHVRGANYVRFLDGIADYGLMGIALNVPGDWTRASAEQKAGATKMIETVKGHPSLLLYQTADEPEIRWMTPAGLKQGYEMACRQDPCHPVYVNHTSSQANAALPRYIHTADITGTDPYPIPRGQPGYVGLLSAKCRTVAETHRKTFMMVLQAFSDYPEIGTRFPSFEEARCMTALALVNGAKGLMYYTYGTATWYVKKNPRFWAGLKAVAGEVAWLAPALLSDPVEQRVTVSPGDAGIEWRLFQYEGKTVLLAVNGRGGPVRAEFVSPALAKAGRVAVLSERRTVAVEDGRFRDEFEPFAVHVYVAGSAALPELAADFVVAKRHHELPETLRDPKDLAAQATGAVARASSQRIYAKWGAAACVNDDNPNSFHMWGKDPKGPHWVEIELAKPTTLSRVVLHTRHVAFFNEFQRVPVAHELQVWGQDRWSTVAERPRIESQISTFKFEPVETRKFRFVFRGKRAQTTRIQAHAE